MMIRLLSLSAPLFSIHLFILVNTFAICVVCARVDAREIGWPLDGWVGYAGYESIGRQAYTLYSRVRSRYLVIRGIARISDKSR